MTDITSRSLYTCPRCKGLMQDTDAARNAHDYAGCHPIQDLTRCAVCTQPLDEEPKLGEMIAHAPCRDYVMRVTQEVAMRTARAAKQDPEFPGVPGSGRFIRVKGSPIEIERLTRYQRALDRIASMPIDPRPDGTYNYSRAALIDIARRALNDE
jgi:hypothetical protein